MGFKTFIFGVILILVAVLYSQWYGDRSDLLDKQELSIIDSWNISISEPKRKFKRITVGYDTFWTIYDSYSTVSKLC